MILVIIFSTHSPKRHISTNKKQWPVGLSTKMTTKQNIKNIMLNGYKAEQGVEANRSGLARLQGGSVTNHPCWLTSRRHRVAAASSKARDFLGGKPREVRSDHHHQRRWHQDNARPTFLTVLQSHWHIRASQPSEMQLGDLQVVMEAARVALVCRHRQPRQEVASLMQKMRLLILVKADSARRLKIPPSWKLKTTKNIYSLDQPPFFGVESSRERHGISRGTLVINCWELFLTFFIDSPCFIWGWWRRQGKFVLKTRIHAYAIVGVKIVTKFCERK